MTLTARLIALGVLLAALVGGWFWLTDHYETRGYERAQAEAREAAEAQTTRNRELQRAAELRYVVQAGVRERVIVRIKKEVRDATLHLAACPVGADGVRLLNEAAACARGDPAATCGRDGAVRKP